MIPFLFALKASIIWLRKAIQEEVILMPYVIAVSLFVLGCTEIFVIFKAFKKMKKKKIPKLISFAMWYASVFGLMLIFLCFDIIFKWI